MMHRAALWLKLKGALIEYNNNYTPFLFKKDVFTFLLIKVTHSCLVLYTNNVLTASQSNRSDSSDYKHSFIMSRLVVWD